MKGTTIDIRSALTPRLNTYHYVDDDNDDDDEEEEEEDYHNDYHRHC